MYPYKYVHTNMYPYQYYNVHINPTFSCSNMSKQPFRTRNTLIIWFLQGSAAQGQGEQRE